MFNESFVLRVGNEDLEYQIDAKHFLNRNSRQMINLAGISLKNERFSALPSVAGPEVRCGQQLHITAGLRGAPPVGRRLAFGNLLVGHGGC